MAAMASSKNKSRPHSRGEAANGRVARLTGGAAAIFALTCLGPETRAAIPGQPGAAAVQTVIECLAEAAKSNSTPDACIGRVTSQCIKVTSTIQEKKTCSDRELLVWIELINHDVVELSKWLADSNLQQALGEVQHNFYAEKISKCAFERNSHNNSPEALLAASICDVESTARQDLWIRKQIESFRKP